MQNKESYIMEPEVYYCEQCAKAGELWGGYRPLPLNKDKCGIHNIPYTRAALFTDEELHVLWCVSRDIEFVRQMEKLKEENLIEFQLKMAEFRNQWAVMKREKQQQQQASSSSITCPTCKSTNVRRIGSVERGASVFALGLFSKKINKSFKCNNCGYTW